MRRTVKIDCFPESIRFYDAGWTVVAIDVIRATTTAVTAVAQGRRCFAVQDLDEAWRAAAGMENPLLVGELQGRMPIGFDLNNSPADIACRADVQRPMILLSSSGTRLICGGRPGQTVYVASLRNYSAQARILADEHDKVVLIGAGSRGAFREEDELCCAWIAGRLLTRGFQPHDPGTLALIEYWKGAAVDAITAGDSARYLQESGQVRDLEFVLTHVDDLDTVCQSSAGEVSPVGVQVSAA
jgi:2-phosphosulfolactate phosphatase